MFYFAGKHLWTFSQYNPWARQAKDEPQNITQTFAY